MRHDGNRSRSTAGCDPTSLAWKTRSRARTHVSLGISGNASANASSAVCIARDSGDAISTSGGGSSVDRTRSPSALACASPSLVSAVSYFIGSSKCGDDQSW